MLIPSVILAIESQDDRDFMENLYRTYKNLMYSEALKYFRKGSFEGDIINDTLIKFIKNMKTVRSLDKKALTNYIVVSIRHTAVDYYRKEKHTIPEDYEDAFSFSKTDHNLTERTVISKLENEEFYRVWHKLDENLRNILEWKYFLGMSDEEISKKLGIKPSSVRMYLTRARRTALALLDEELDNEFKPAGNTTD